MKKALRYIAFTSIISSCSGAQKAAETTCGVAERQKVEEILGRDIPARDKLVSLLVEVGPEYVACVVANSRSIAPIDASVGHD